MQKNQLTLEETLSETLAAYCPRERVIIHADRTQWDDIPVEVTFEVCDGELVFESSKLAENYMDNEGVKCIYQFGDDFDLTDKEMKEATEMAQENVAPEQDVDDLED